MNEVLRVTERLSTLDRDTASRQGAELQSLIDSGCHRQLAFPPHDWKSETQKLRDEHPNFAGVIDGIVLPQLAIAAASGISRQSPCLLVGPPSVGKTHFARSLARTFHVPSAVLDMSIASTSASLVGLASTWSNSHAGKLFKLLVHGDARIPSLADPLVFLDEVDKAGSGNTGRAFTDPIGSLYTLLEQDSARYFEDESLPSVYLDAGYVRWVMAANTLDSIPGPILSRCHVFEIPELTLEERRLVYRRVFSQVVLDTNVAMFEPRLGEDVLTHSLSMHARLFKSMCAIGIGRALADGRTIVDLHDFRPVNARSITSRRIGFAP